MNMYNKIYQNINNDFFYSHVTINNPMNVKYEVHFHDRYEILYFISGDANYYIEGHAFKLSSMDLLLINKNELHRPVFNSNNIYERIVIELKPDYLSSFMDLNYNIYDCFEKKPDIQFSIIKSDDVVFYGLNKYIEKIEECISANTPEKHVMIKAYFTLLIVAINNAISKKDNVMSYAINNYDLKTMEILDFISKNLDKKITLDLLESKFFVSKYYLCHLFKKNTGLSVGEFIACKRIMKAKELLAKNVPVMDVCLMTGYNDYSNFYKTFKKLVGISPKEFSKNPSQYN